MVNNFKAVKTEYSKKNIKVESFTSYEDYSLALMSAIASDKTPDVFVLNNNEKQSVFTNQIV
jgi:ABC-type glycerol-3-phosphate transport system substrate-binding protein